MQQTNTKARPAKGKANQPRNSAAQLFSDIANRTSQAAGRALTFMIAAGIILVWAVTGPIFQYSDTWQLVINTGTTIVTFLMVFLIQNAQNRDSAAIQVKLDELIRVSKAHNSFMGLERLSDDELEAIRAECLAQATAKLAAEGRLRPDQQNYGRPASRTEPQ